MPSCEFVLIPSVHSDGISLEKDGPRLTREFDSRRLLDSGRSYRTEACFVPRMVARRFVTTLTVADGLTYFEGVDFERRTVISRFSETTNVFIPRDSISQFRSCLLFEPDATSRRYTAGLEMTPARRFDVVATSESGGEEDEQMVNGDVRD